MKKIIFVLLGLLSIKSTMSQKMDTVPALISCLGLSESEYHHSDTVKASISIIKILKENGDTNYLVTENPAYFIRPTYNIDYSKPHKFFMIMGYRIFRDNEKEFASIFPDSTELIMSTSKFLNENHHSIRDDMYVIDFIDNFKINGNNNHNMKLIKSYQDIIEKYPDTKIKWEDKYE